MDKKRKNLSGSQYKNRRRMKEAEGIKLSYAMREFLTQKSCQGDTSTSTARLVFLAWLRIRYVTQSGYDQMKITANEIAERDCATEFPTESEVRPRRKKRLFDYEKFDDEPLSEKTKFKINFFNYILDITINSLNERFTLLNTHSKELLDISRMLPHSTKALDVINYLCQNNLITLYPNTAVALRILLTLPVTVASGERTFSKLKLIKNYVRSTISQLKLRNLSVISIENKLATSLEYRALIDEFAKLKVRRVKL
ncbi:hypothetical protein RN001_002612 [Aquatica leii]|uniref:HAT C-terminal dimerisation domain-containing protein n=1 Tax=Aquatica leii TaxID=1421715 RepID=A0AAN7PQ26_9COLE|nr:hypothetical protein RN001_002612 [Aquatica leii]